MVVLGAANVSKDSQDVNDALKALREEGKECFLVRLKRGVADGEFSEGTDVDTLASTLNTMFHGMSIQARDGVSHEELERVAAVAMTLIPPAPVPPKRHSA
jgi:hypothetical protein